MKKVFTLLTKTLLVAVCLLGGTSSAWADDVIFSLTNVSVESDVSVTKQTSHTIVNGTEATIVGGTAEVYNGKSSDANMLISKNKQVTIGGSGASYFHVSLTGGNKIAEGDVIAFGSNSGTGYIAKTSTKPGSTITISSAGYTVPAGSELIGQTEIYYWKPSNGEVKQFTEFTITRISGTHAPSITQDGNNVTMTCATDGATIYYTIDGSEPTTSSDTYSSAITLTNSCTVRTFAKKGDDASDIAKKDCYVTHASALEVLKFNAGELNSDKNVWTGTYFTLTDETAGRTIQYVNLAGSQDGFKLNANDVYTIQPSEGIKLTKIIVVGKTWLTGSAGNASTIAFDGFTPASGTFFDYLTDGETYVKTLEFTPSTEQTYGQAITMRPTINQLGAYIEVYGTIKTYTVTYAAGTNGTGSIAAGEKTYGVAFPLSSSTFTRDGYVQTGWATSDGGPQIYALGGSYTANADVTLYPVWAEGGSVAAFNYTDGKTISQLEALGWTFNSASFDGDPADTEPYVNLVSAFTTENLTAPGTNSMADNAIAFAKNTTAYAMYDLGAVKTITAVNATLYGGSSSSFDAIIEYIGANGSTVKKSSTITLNAGNWAANNISLRDEVPGVRYIKIYGASKWMVMYNLSVTHKESVSVATKSGRNYGTYVTPADIKLDFSAAEGITAYIATGFNGDKDAIVLQSVNVVPAGTPIIVNTETKGATVNVPVTTADADDVSDNALVAGDGTTAWNGTDGYTYYYIASDQFHKATSGTLKSGKAYLKVANGEVPTAPVLNFVFDLGETTSIADVRSNKAEVSGEVYNLNGQRVAQPQKGLYIVNGKKVVIK